MPNYIFNKIFIEARYNNALFFNDLNKIQSIIDEAQGIFPNSNFEPNQKILILNNLEKHYTANISANRFIVDVDRPQNFESVKIIAEELLRICTNNLNIKNFGRLGMRTFRGIPKNNLWEANKYIKEKLFKFDDRLFNIVGNNISNLGISFMFTDGNYKTMLNIKSASMQTFEINLNPTVVSEVNLSSMTKTQTVDEILIDSDIFQDGIVDVEFAINNFINDVIKINNSKINEFIRNVSIQ
ncbi:hypothetical protein [Clostridium diolis]|uniref:TIGR04255 family protein n=1 Tax=Clostridium diolis TaxID=223919 RepID=A0AAV3W923_9CLOT|nr:hypothetical protein [Clostridium diolis]QES71617.1 hypothetical protein F3K33_01790 [Clostridium diolis]GEA33626.1 hypothetical protein CDIOL_45490 [Clostridium diolis]